MSHANAVAREVLEAQVIHLHDEECVRTLSITIYTQEKTVFAVCSTYVACTSDTTGKENNICGVSRPDNLWEKREVVNLIIFMC